MCILSCYKANSFTKRPMLQTAQCNTQRYKTPNVTKSPILQKVHILCEKKPVIMYDFFSSQENSLLLKFLKVSFLESRAAARSSNTFHLKLHF